MIPASFPKSKKEEIHKVFPSYSKYISRSFPDKGKAMEDREVLSTRCYICDKAARKKDPVVYTKRKALLQRFLLRKAWLFKGKDPYPEKRL